MGQIANQMALELFFRIKERIKEKKKQKKKSSRLPFFCTAMYYTDGSVTAIRLHITKIPRRGNRQLVCRDVPLS